MPPGASGSPLAANCQHAAKSILGKVKADGTPVWIARGAATKRQFLRLIIGGGDHGRHVHVDLSTQKPKGIVLSKPSVGARALTAFEALTGQKALVHVDGLFSVALDQLLPTSLIPGMMAVNARVGGIPVRLRAVGLLIWAE